MKLKRLHSTLYNISIGLKLCQLTKVLSTLILSYEKKPNQIFVKLWTFKCWIKVNSYDTSACGVLVPGNMTRSVVSSFRIDIIYWSSSLMSVRACWLSKKCCIYRHRKQYLSFGYSFVTGKSITIILPNCISNYNSKCSEALEFHIQFGRM
jgi:hypothetical protein